MGRACQPSRWLFRRTGAFWRPACSTRPSSSSTPRPAASGARSPAMPGRSDRSRSRRTGACWLPARLMQILSNSGISPARGAEIVTLGGFASSSCLRSFLARWTSPRSQQHGSCHQALGFDDGTGAAELESQCRWSLVAFSPDGRTRAAGSTEHTVKLWDIASGREVRAMRGQTGDFVSLVAFSPDGRIWPLVEL